MRSPTLATALAAALLAGLPAGRTDAAAPVRERGTVATPPARTAFGALRMPCDFEENLGQTAAEVDYVARCSGYVAFLTHGDAVIRTDRESFRLRLVGGCASSPRASLPRPGRSHYFKGGDAVPNAGRVGRVDYDDVLPGVGIAYRTEERHLAFDLLLDAGADAASVRLAIDGVAWLGPDAAGNLAIGLPSGGTAQLSAPRAWQGDGAARRDVTVAFARGASGNEVAFDVGAHDPSLPLVIDPGLTVSTYLGGSAAEQDAGSAIRTDTSGAIYLTGSTYSADFPVTVGAFQTAKGEITPTFSDVFVTKFDAAGTAVVWSTYLGGSANDSGSDLAVDAAGAVYVGGSTASANFPLQSAFQSTAAGGFLTKINPSGSSLAWSTYFTYRATRLGLDATGNVRCFDTSVKRVFAFNATGTSLLVSVTIDGFSPPNFSFTSLAVLPSGDVWLGGYLSNNQSDITTGGAFQSAFGGATDGWLVKVNTAGNETYRSYLGGSGDDFVQALALDSSGNLFVAGTTESANFPVANAHQAVKGSGANAFVMKFDPAASTPTFSTFLGGAGLATPRGIAVSAMGEVFVAGNTNATDLPVFNAFQGQNAGSYDAFLTEFSGTGTLLRSSYFGGAANDSAASVAVSSVGRPLIAGNTSSVNFPTGCATQAGLRGSPDVFLAGISTSAVMLPDESPYQLPGATVGSFLSRQLTIFGGSPPLTCSMHSGSLPAGLTLATDGVLSGTPSAAVNASFFVKIRDLRFQCDDREFRLVVSPAPTVPASALAAWTVDRPLSVALPRLDGTAPFTWDLASGAPPPGTSITADGFLTGTPTAAANYSFDARITDANGAEATGTISILINPAPAFATVTLPAWTETRPYHQLVSLVGGTPPFAWDLASGSLPIDRAVDSATGTIDGTALAAGNYAFTERATDAAGSVATRLFTVRLNALPTFTATQLPFAVQGRPYATPVPTAGGTPPFLWSLRSGAFGLGLTGIDAATGVVGGTPGATGATSADVQLVDAAGASVHEALGVVVVPRMDLATGKGSAQFAITQFESGKDVMRWVELLAGSTLDVTAKVTRANLFAIDVIVLDSAERPLDLEEHKKSKDPVVSVKRFPVPRTGRYLVIVRQPVGFSGNVALQVSARAATKADGGGAVDPAGGSFTFAFSAPPGSTAVISTSAAKGSRAVPTIVSLKDASGAELLVPADLKQAKHGATLKPKVPLAGGDYVATMASAGAVAGAATCKVSVKPPKGYGFALPDLPVTGR